MAFSFELKLRPSIDLLVRLPPCFKEPAFVDIALSSPKWFGLAFSAPALIDVFSFTNSVKSSWSSELRLLSYGKPTVFA